MVFMVSSLFAMVADAGLLTRDERRLTDMSWHKSSNCCGLDRARLSVATAVSSSTARHLVADASTGLQASDLS